MRPVAPRINGADEFTIAEEQEQFKTIVGCHVKYPDGQIGLVTRWKLAPEELARAEAGEDIYVVQLTNGGPMMPMSVYCGTKELLG